MPEDDYVWLPRSSLLTFEEIARITAVFTSQGVTKVRLTGGEPLLRHDLPALVRLLRANPQIDDLALTTNGTLLARDAAALRQAGLGRVTVSLDTLRPDRAEAFSRTTRHGDILTGIAEARAVGFGVKLNTVVIRDFNDDELVDLLGYAREIRAELRFIEYMDVGGATRWSMDDVVSRRDILAQLAAAFGPIEPLTDGIDPRAPAERFRLRDGTVFGIVASTTAPFCRACDRSRLTADGTWYRCLYAADGIDLREPLRAGATDAELADIVRTGWTARIDRGAEERFHLGARGALYQLGALREDPHREMHTRGG